MLIEQAFTGLPESLVGKPYQEQEYEGGIVSAFSLALLQEMNGRNVPNPISLLRAEALYNASGFTVNNTRHYWRADLHVNLLPVRAGSYRLERYGLRFSNWLEAKFFRKRGANPGEQETNKTKNTSDLLIDFLRLSCLVPREMGSDGKTYAGRYLLHVYDDEPPFRVSMNYRDGEDIPRDWLAAITTTGPAGFDSLQLDVDAAMSGKLGPDMSKLGLSASVSTIALTPVRNRLPNEQRLYWCYLTRIDELTVSWDLMRWRLDKDRTIEEGAEHDYDRIREIIAEQLVGKVPDAPEPDADELESAHRAEEQAELMAEIDPYVDRRGPFNEI